MYTFTCVKVVLNNNKSRRVFKYQNGLRRLVEINERRGLERKISGGLDFLPQTKKKQLHCIALPFKKFKKDAEEKRENDGAK